MQLPRTEPSAMAHSQRLLTLIRDEISANGPMPMDRFWQLAQFHPQLGYYHNGLAKFGAEGDFVTAPELGQVFGRCLASWLARVLHALGRSTGPQELLELGAGSGALAATVLTALDDLGALPDRYQILEVSGELRQRQRSLLLQRVPQLVERVVWLDQPPARQWQGVVFGNEVLDALPARRFLLGAGGWQELCVVVDGDRLQWQPQPAQPRHIAMLPRSGLEPGYTTELQPMLADWIGAMTTNLTRGAALWIDYGYVASEYFHPQRTGGTAIAHYRHRAHDDLLARPGVQDLSVSVNFSQLAAALDHAGMTVASFCGQARFLIETGLEEQLLALERLPDAERWPVLSEIKQLTLPSEMGDRFSVMSAGRDVNLPAIEADQRGRL